MCIFSILITQKYFKNGKLRQMRVSESRDCLQAMPSESILEQAKLGQLRIERERAERVERKIKVCAKGAP